jgi:signal transduction histidine kinase/EAL domain-containing protein (putative c-di-GMP-specific phosphodiesterase class I)/GGDEF domain-containing protein
MSILRRLVLSITIAIAVILLGTQFVFLRTASRYYNSHLQTSSTTSAAMLAIALANLHSDDSALRHQLVEAVFTPGTFRRIRVMDAQGKVVVDLRNPPGVDTAPPWFHKLAALRSPGATQPIVMFGVPAGSVTVQADNKAAWDALWVDSLGTAAVVVLTGTIWLLFAIGLARWIEKRLLYEVGMRVRDLGRAEAPSADLPPVRELASVADALSETRDRLRMTAEESSARIESLQVELNLDAVTRLPNRKYFFNELRRNVAPRGELVDDANDEGAALPAPTGHVLLIRQRDLAEINRHMPRDLTDQWLRSLAHRLEEQVGQKAQQGRLLARLNGSDFALLLPGTPAPQARQVVQRVRQELRALRLPLGDQRWCRWALALAPYGAGNTAGELLARLDNALMRAENRDSDEVIRADSADDTGQPGEYGWRDTLITALDQHRFSLDVQRLAPPQPDVDRGAEAAGGAPWLRPSQEATLVLHASDTRMPVPADVFMPAAVRLSLSAECDIQAVRLGLDWLVGHPDSLIVRLELASIGTPSFLQRLSGMLDARRAQAGRLVLEIDAHGLHDRLDQVRALCETASEAGIRVGIRNISQELSALSGLHQVPVAYLKLDRAFVAGLPHSPGSRNMAAAIAATAQGLGIDVYAKCQIDQDADIARILDDLGIRPVWCALVPARGGATDSDAQDVQVTALDPLTEADPDEAGGLDSGTGHTATGGADDTAAVTATQAQAAGGAAGSSASREANALASQRTPSVATRAAERRLADLDSALGAQRQMHSLMSHELRGPVATISAAAQSLQMMLSGSGEAIDGRLQRIHRAITRITELMDQLLNEDQLYDRAFQAQQADVDMVALARGVVQDMQPDAAHPLVLRAPAPVQAWCDSALMALVLRNLIHNAVKYSPADQPITIEVGTTPGEAGQAMAWVAVTDHGPGIDAPDQVRIFSGHYRRAAHRETKGLGIGLHLVRRICERQHGTLTVQSEPGKGARFVASLPSAPALTSA